MISITYGAEATVLSFLMPVLQSEWSLSVVQQSALGSSYFVGSFIGCVISGQLADRFGRRRPLLFSVLFHFLFGIGSGIAQNYDSLSMIRLLYGIAVGILSTISTTYICEISPMEIRGKVLVFTGMFFTLGEIITCGVAYVCLDTVSSGNWRALVVWTAIPGVITYVLMVKYLEESPRYLLIFQNFDEAMKLINRMIRKNNNSEMTTLTQEEKELLRNWAQKQAQTHKSSSLANPLELFQGERFRITICLWIIWYVLSCTYDGLVFILPTILRDTSKNDANQFLTIFLSILAEFPSSIISYFMIEHPYFGRKRSLIYTFGLSTISCFAAYGIGSFAFIFAATSARFWLNMTWNVIFPFTTEIYPTNVRVTGLGVASSLSKIGGMTMPWITIACLKIGYTGPFLIFGVLSLWATVSSICLPYDTAGMELDQDKNAEEEI